MSPARSLPEAYAALEPFVEAWAIASLADRAQRRGASTPQERQALYDALKDMAPAILQELDCKPLAELDAHEQRLLQLLLSYGQVALAIEIRGDGEAAHAAQSRHMVITR